MAAQLHIAISPETLFSVGGLEITNTLFTSYLVSIVLILTLLIARTKIKQTNKPSGLQNLLEAIVDGLYSFFNSITNSHNRTRALTPIVASFFIFIALNNWVELLPGFHTIVYTGEPNITFTNIPFVDNAQNAHATTHNIPVVDPNLSPAAHDADVVEYNSGENTTQKNHENSGVALLRGANADLNMTLALALVSVGAVQYFGLRQLGTPYLKKYFNFSSPIMFFVGLLELVSEFSKVLSFAFRLFGNIFAGEVLIGVISFLIPAILPIPFIGLEIFVGFIQALVFSMLSLVFMNMAMTQEHH